MGSETVQNLKIIEAKIQEPSQKNNQEAGLREYSQSQQRKSSFLGLKETSLPFRA